MEANELIEKIKNNPTTIKEYEEVLCWCSENIKNINFNDESCVSLYEISMKYLMKAKILNWNKDDIKVIINYLTKNYARKFGIEKNINVNIMDLEEYQKMYGEKTVANCYRKSDGSFDIVYSSIVENQLMDYDPDKLLRGMQTVFHEVVHAIQGTKIYSNEVDRGECECNGNIYIMTLETILREIYPKFYYENYNNLIKENQAEYLGLMKAMNTFGKYNSKLYNIYDINEIKEKLNKYDKNCYWENNDILFEGKNVNAKALLDFASTQYVKKFPETLKIYPVLQYAFNDDGSRKGVIELIEDRKKLLENEKSSENLDNLYATIANYKNLEKTEVSLLYNYIATTGTNDEFIFKLLKYRLDRSILSPDKKEELMQLSRKSAEIARQSMNLEKNYLRNHLGRFVNSDEEVIYSVSKKDGKEINTKELEDGVR